MCFRIEQDFEDLGALITFLEEVFSKKMEVELPFVPSSNIALTNDAWVVAQVDESLKFEPMRFGLVPSWKKVQDSKLGNARSETAWEKPSFRSAFRKRRCLIPVTGFYEWRLDPGETRKTPYKVTPLNQDYFFLAGLWEYWKPQELLSFTILTTQPNELMEQLHNRMPVILESQFNNDWLDPENDDVNYLNSMLKPFSAQDMAYQPYDRYVSSVGNKDKEKIIPVGEKVTY